MKANLFIVGAMKAGTTSLSDMLANHSAIYFSPIKEPSFFTENLPSSIYDPSPFFSLDEYFKKKFPQHLHIAHVRDEGQYKRLFALAAPQHKYLAEASTSYLHAPEAGSNIYNYNASAKIIIVIRDRMARAFSHYNMDLGLGRVRQSFEEIIKRDIAAYEKGELSPLSYLGMSIYAEPINRYKGLFGENVIVLNFEKLSAGQNEQHRLFDFLELSDEGLAIDRKNQSSNIANGNLLYYLRKTGLKPIFSLLLSSRLRQKIFKKVATKSGSKKIELTSEVKGKLEAIFNEDAALMGKDYVFA